jgi:hypothetical protein
MDASLHLPLPALYRQINAGVERLLESARVSARVGTNWHALARIDRSTRIAGQACRLSRLQRAGPSV